MTGLSYVQLPHRCLFLVSGADPRTFLQGLVSADLTREDCALWGAFLTPQGRFLHEFFLAEDAAGLVLETDRDGRDAFIQRLKRYDLRRQIDIAPIDGRTVFALFGAGAAEAVCFPEQPGLVKRLGQGLAFTDPRRAEVGLRCWMPEATTLETLGFEEAFLGEWDDVRIRQGLPDGYRDLVPDQTLLLEAGFDELGGVDWNKGCFLGQEVTARSKYRGHVKQRLMPVAFTGPAPAFGTPIVLGDAAVGEMRSHSGSVGLAVIRLDAVASGGPLTAGEATLTPWKPDWAVF